MSHPFICPNCGHRTSELDRNLGFTRQRKGCSKCGFAFLFELLDDYYPAPDAAFFVCDGQGRVVGCGRNSFAFTGLEEEDVIGQRVEQVLGLQFANGDDPVDTVLEWGVRALRRGSDSGCNGTTISVSRFGNAKLAGKTPTISLVSPFRLTARPITSGFFA